MQRNTITRRLNEMFVTEKTKLLTAKDDKIKLHEDKRDGLAKLIGKINALDLRIDMIGLMERDVYEVELKTAITAAIQAHPRLAEGTFSSIKKYFNEIAPGWNKPQIAPTNKFAAKRNVDGEYDCLFKIVLLGDTQVGKSVVMNNAGVGKSNYDGRSTIGVEFRSVIIDKDQVKAKLQIWDTAGQERFRSITKAYIRGTIETILMFDITNKKSFENIEQWYLDVMNNEPESMIILVGNKSDLTSERKVAAAEAQAFAEKRKIQYMEINGNNKGDVNSLFETITTELLAKFKNTNGMKF